MSESLLSALRDAIGPTHVLTGSDTEAFARDWSGAPTPPPLAVLRPANTQEVSSCLQLAHAQYCPVVPVSGGTGLTGGTEAGDMLMLSLGRLNSIREIRPEARLAIVEAGVILSRLHDAVADHDLIFPLTFGARGSALIGGALATNAGGSNVVRYGSTRGLCLGLEAVMADGRVLNLMSEVHKDNSGYDLRDLLIGSEGTLGIITGAVLKLEPLPRAYASAMVACPSIDAALVLLRALQADSGGTVEAFEYMPRSFIEAHLARFPDARAPFSKHHDVNILVEMAAVSDRMSDGGDTGQTAVACLLENALAAHFETGEVLDATLAKSEAERQEMWARRESSAELALLHQPVIDNDICVPVDRMQHLLDRAEARAKALDPGIRFLNVAHLGDGNLHFAAWPATEDTTVHKAICRAVEEEAVALGGAFSAEHGVGLSKLDVMSRLKDPVALDVMRAVKHALDPRGILNPGKVVPVLADGP
ncbi:MAG: FAD-binding oxidoreductase [Pseudomonadota bacterium]